MVPDAMLPPECEEAGLPRPCLLRNVPIDWETPSARMNCSLSSMLVRPLAGGEKGDSGVSGGEKAGICIVFEKQAWA